MKPATSAHQFRPGATGGGGHSGAVPLPNDCLYLSKRRLCPEEIYRLGATGAQIEAYDSQIGAYRSRIREQELFFRSFVDSHRIS